MLNCNINDLQWHSIFRMNAAHNLSKHHFALVEPGFEFRKGHFFQSHILAFTRDLRRQMSKTFGVDGLNHGIVTLGFELAFQVNQVFDIRQKLAQSPFQLLWSVPSWIELLCSLKTFQSCFIIFFILQSLKLKSFP